MRVILGLNKSSIRSLKAHEQIDGDGNVHTFMKEAESVVQGFDSLYLYMDVVESRVVGDSVVPLVVGD